VIKKLTLLLIFYSQEEKQIVKLNPEIYRFLASNSTFDFLPKGSKDTYSLKFRIIKIKISENNYETLVTDL
jgi:hypothetical protein